MYFFISYKCYHTQRVHRSADRFEQKNTEKVHGDAIVYSKCMLLSTTLERFRAMRPSARALIFVFWIYALASSLVSVFTQIFLYQKFTSLFLNVVATMVSHTGIMIGFCVPGYLAALWRLNIKGGFLTSFILMGASIYYLLHISTISQAYLAMFFWGVGFGVFYLCVNTFELTETKDAERDFYSSVLNAGNQIISFAGPAIAVFLIWLSSSVLHSGTYTLLFTVVPFIYLLGFFFFGSIRDYRPLPIQWADVRHYITDRRNQAAQIYTLGTGFQQIIGVTIPPIAILFILGTTLNVGIYNTLFAIFSALCILVVAQYRTPSNRLQIYGITTLGFALAIVWFGYAFTFTALIIYTIVEGILSPLMNVSSHVIDLNSMEIGRDESDFYATMILRDFFLWVWRCAGGIVLLVVISSLGTEKASLTLGFYLMAAGYLVTYLGAYLLIKIQRKEGLSTLKRTEVVP